MTIKEIIAEKAERHEKEIKLYCNAPEPLDAVKDDILFVNEWRGNYGFYLNTERTLDEVMEILRGHDYKLESYGYCGSTMDVSYIVDGIMYTFKVKDTETILPILSNGKCKIVEHTETSKRLVCDM